MNNAYLLLGGNVGETKKLFNSAIEFIEKSCGRVSTQSSLYKTEAWGFKAQNDFLNQVIVIETPLKPSRLMARLLKIEASLGRRRTQEKWKARKIDIDILFYESPDGTGQYHQLVISEKNLKIPHPYLHLRKFTLAPLYEVAPGINHPEINKNIAQLLAECPDQSKVVQLYN